MTPSDSVLVESEQAAAANQSAQTSRERPSREEAERAVRTLIEWIGEDPDREGLLDTPKRVVKCYEEVFSGYLDDPMDMLARTFTETEDYDEIVLLKGMRFNSFCEHHILPIIGTAHIAYLPTGRVVGISKLARVVEAYAKRLQIQERLTAQIAQSIETVLNPIGVAILIESEHQCMTLRGVEKPGVKMTTTRFLGSFKDDKTLRHEFLQLVKNS